MPLAMMCVGRDKTGAVEYVQSQLPALELAAEYMDVQHVQHTYSQLGQPNSPDVVAMCLELNIPEFLFAGF